MKFKFSCLLLLLSFASLYAQNRNHVGGDLIVQLKPKAQIQTTIAHFSRLNGQSAKLRAVEELSAPLRIWLLHFDDQSANENEVLDKIRQIPSVQAAQFNHFISLRETVPSDPNFSAQWQWVNTGQNGGNEDADVDADLAWDLTTGGTTADGKEIVVCVMEGANRNNPDLQGNLWFNTAETPGNSLDDDNNGYVDDYNGWNSSNNNDNIPSAAHGTQVSGMIGAKGDNGQFVAGINWNVKIMHVLVGGLNEANVVKAYTYPLVQRKRFNESGGTQGAFVVVTNASWGIDGGDPAESPLWCSFYDSLGVEGILSCGATANNNVNIDQVLDLPTACPSEYMVAVTATNNKDVRTFSGFGTTHVDVGAPGESIVTLSTNGGPSTTSGTSFASPLVAGIVALLYSAPCSSIGQQAIENPAATAILIRDAIFGGVDIIPNLVDETKYGGRVNAFNSLNLILQNCGPCPAAYSINFSEIQDNSVQLNWQSSDSTLHTNIRYRKIGDPDWIVFEAITSPFQLQNLEPCNNYELQLEEICASDSSGYSSSYFFSSEGCCVSPANPIVSGTSQSSALFSWEPVYAANSYNVQLTSNGIAEIITDITDPFLQLNNLQSCTEYQVQVQTVCDTGATDFTLPIEFETFGCGACIDLSYCQSTIGQTQFEWIDNVTIASINNTSGSNDGYGDFTSTDGGTDLQTYTSNIIILTPGYSASGTFPETFTVFIDFNQDGDFNDSGERTFDSANTTTATTGNIVIPGNAVLGSTRMRVSMNWNGQVSGACSSLVAGEVEDYCINIVAGTPPNCFIPNDLALTDTTTTTASLAWASVDDANSYSLRYRKSGLSNWTTVEATMNSLELTQLLECTEYEVEIRCNCTGTNSGYSDSFFFTTTCTPSANFEALEAKLGIQVSPNPFEREFSIGFQLDSPQTVDIQLLDVLARELGSKHQLLSAGPNQVKFDGSELPSGVYFVKIKVEQGELSKRIVKQ